VSEDTNVTRPVIGWNDLDDLAADLNSSHEDLAAQIEQKGVLNVNKGLLQELDDIGTKEKFVNELLKSQGDQK